LLHVAHEMNDGGRNEIHVAHMEFKLFDGGVRTCLLCLNEFFNYFLYLSLVYEREEKFVEAVIMQVRAYDTLK
jgi:hypothetical protein